MRFSSIALFAVVGSAVAQVGGGPGDKGLSTSPDSDGCKAILVDKIFHRV